MATLMPNESYNSAAPLILGTTSLSDGGTLRKYLFRHKFCTFLMRQIMFN